MSTPVINAIDNVNDDILKNLFQAVANNATARENLSQSNRNIDAVVSNTSATTALGDNGGQDEAIRLCLCRRSGRDPANFPNTATDIIQDGTFRGEILGDAILSGLLSASKPGMEEIASSATFSSELAASQTAMQEVAASQTAMDTVAASQTAMQEVAASQNAMDTVAASQTAKSAVAASSTAISAIEAASTSGSNSVPITNSASIYVAELLGGGGGGNGGDLNGDDGGDTTFNQSAGRGGQGALASRDGDNRGASVSSPDVLITEQVGGGGSGGASGSSGEFGGSGGFAKVLIANPNRNTLSLSVGGGGSSSGDGLPGEDGSATIFTPNAF